MKLSGSAWEIRLGRCYCPVWTGMIKLIQSIVIATGHIICLPAGCDTGNLKGTLSKRVQEKKPQVFRLLKRKVVDCSCETAGVSYLVHC